MYLNGEKKILKNCNFLLLWYLPTGFYLFFYFPVRFIGICTSNLNFLFLYFVRNKRFPSWKPFQPSLVSTQNNFLKLWFQKLQRAQMLFLREIFKIISSSAVQKILTVAAAGVFEGRGVLFQQWNNSNYLCFRGKQRKQCSGRQMTGWSFCWEWSLYLSSD